MSPHVKSRHAVSYHIMTCLHHVSAHRGGPRGPNVAERSVLETSVEQCHCCSHRLAACRSTPNTGCFFNLFYNTTRDADVLLRSERGCGGHVGPDCDNTRGQTTVCTGAYVRECPVKVGATSQVHTVVEGICCEVRWEMSAGCLARTNSGTLTASAETSARHCINTT